MKQTPVPGSDPFEPPGADAASAYLAEAGALVNRREERIDRRMLSRLLLIDGLVVGALFSAALFVIQSSGPAVPPFWSQVVLALIIWMDLSGQLRERIGVRLPWFRSWSVPYLVVFVPTLIVAWVLSQARFPSTFLVLAPLGISIVVFGVLAVRQWRQAKEQSRADRLGEPDPFTRRVAIATVVVGIMLAALIISTGVSGAAALAIPTALMIVVLVFTIAAQTGSWVPGLGGSWRWQQWAALGIAGVLFLASLTLGAAQPAAQPTVAIAMGAFIVVLFVVVAVWGDRNERSHERAAISSTEGVPGGSETDE